MVNLGHEDYAYVDSYIGSTCDVRHMMGPKNLPPLEGYIWLYLKTLPIQEGTAWWARKSGFHPNMHILWKIVPPMMRPRKWALTMKMCVVFQPLKVFVVGWQSRPHQWRCVYGGWWIQPAEMLVWLELQVWASSMNAWIWWKMSQNWISELYWSFAQN